MNNNEIIQKLESIEGEVVNLINSLKSKPEEEPVVEEPIEPTPSSSKRALVVGVNKYDPALECDLNGCVNDMNNIANTLIGSFGFSSDDVVRLSDYDATKANIIAELDKLVLNSSEGDQLVFYFSGHGSQVPDTNGDEIDKLDEILCPTDLDWNDPFTDDIIANAFKQVPTGAHLTFLCDSCHSGTVSRISLPPSGKGGKRFLDPPEELLNQFIGKDLPINKMGQKALVGVQTQRHILFAGCAEDNYSYEGRFGGVIQGAFTWNFCDLAKKRPHSIWRDIENRVSNRLRKQGYFQVPQLVTMPTNFDLTLFGN